MMHIEYRFTIESLYHGVDIYENHDLMIKYQVNHK